MVEELLLRARRELPLLKEKKTTADTTHKSSPPPKIMDHPELSLGPSMFSFTESSSFESEANNVRKRKLSSWEHTSNQTNIDLQLNNSLPLDWEQCLDLQTGRMYCINRKTQRKSWVKPKEQKLDLDLNISNLPTSEDKKPGSLTINDTKPPSGSDNGGGMVAIVCLNCYLLVMLYRSSPSCPNCKFMHSLLPSPVPQNLKPVKSLETLSLLH
ncbi:uncharacterized protein LOC110032727 [Phalaenopsis equestris]|uniref:uncharacterized protein LOC110032727 n=1 Tax=Phalaenopsis equestris TaxID=78828 RepID=UPI0009E2E798|nr:uncharacterized protein LOC110032727 [Phalaenopsis equestris]